jgi:hypothetical protein
MTIFVLEKMSEIIKTNIRTDKGFKEVHPIVVVKTLLEHRGEDVISTQVYNVLRKWRVRWLIISRL